VASAGSRAGRVHLVVENSLNLGRLFVVARLGRLWLVALAQLGVSVVARFIWLVREHSLVVDVALLVGGTHVRRGLLVGF